MYASPIGLGATDVPNTNCPDIVAAQFATKACESIITFPWLYVPSVKLLDPNVSPAQMFNADCDLIVEDTGLVKAKSYPDKIILTNMPI